MLLKINPSGVTAFHELKYILGKFTRMGKSVNAAFPHFCYMITHSLFIGHYRT